MISHNNTRIKKGKGKINTKPSQHTPNYKNKACPPRPQQLNLAHCTACNLFVCQQLKKKKKETLKKSLENDGGSNVKRHVTFPDQPSKCCCWQSSFLNRCEKSLQASMLRSTAAASATNAAASSVQFTCGTLISTVGLLHLPSPPTLADIMNPPLYRQ